MVIPSPNKRVEKLEPSKAYWCSSSLFGTARVFLIAVTETYALVSRIGTDQVAIRLSESTFFYEKPVRR